MNILEAKLTSEHRNELPDKEFGLPKERKFPLHDKSHVLSAIKFFKYAKADEKRELAKNINMKLNKFDMTVNVSEDNPFYKYIDRKRLIVKESTNIITESSFSYTKGSNPNKEFDRIIIDLMEFKNSGNITESSIYKKEKEIYDFIKTNTDTTNLFESFLVCINQIFHVIYEDYFNYMDYIGTKLSKMYYCVLYDIWNSAVNKLNNNITDISLELYIYNKFYMMCFMDHIKIYNHNEFYLYRIKYHLYTALMNCEARGIKIPDNINLNELTEPVLDNAQSICINMVIGGLLNVNIFSYDSVISELEKYKKQIENEVYIINTSYNQSFIHGTRNNLSTLYHIENEKINDIINHFNTYHVSIKCLNKIMSGVTYTLTDVDLMRLKKTKYIDYFVIGEFSNNGKFWFGTDNHTIYIIGKVISDTQVSYKLVTLNNDEIINYVMYGGNMPKTTIVNITFPEKNDIDFTTTTLTEGFSVNENGDIKITINPKKSYMDEYMETHRMLKENHKNHNYDAMKQNVAFMFLLISIIERDKRYKSREPEIVKARAFAINDFKTYLSHIQKNDSSFNFEKYYKETEFDKYVINISKETILGIRNLLKTIML